LKDCRKARKVRKAYTNKLKRELRKKCGSNSDLDMEYSGVLNKHMRLMTNVETSLLLIDHTFLTKKILLIQIAEEANYWNCQITIQQSNNFQVHTPGSKGSISTVHAISTATCSWKVSKCITREVRLFDNFAVVDKDVDGAIAESEPGVEIEEGDANGFSMRVRDSSPLKSRWFVPMIGDHIAELPNISNKDIKTIIGDYVNAKFITPSLLQNSRTAARAKVFGNPSKNVMFANSLVDKLKEGGHNVKMITKERKEILVMLE